MAQDYLWDSHIYMGFHHITEATQDIPNTSYSDRIDSFYPWFFRDLRSIYCIHHAGLWIFGCIQFYETDSQAISFTVEFAADFGSERVDHAYLCLAKIICLFFRYFCFEEQNVLLVLHSVLYIII